MVGCRLCTMVRTGMCCTALAFIHSPWWLIRHDTMSRTDGIRARRAGVGRALLDVVWDAAAMEGYLKRSVRRNGISRRAGSGRQCTRRTFALDLMDLASPPSPPPEQPPPTAAKTPAAWAPAPADVPASVTASTGRRSGTFGTPVEGVPERLMLKTPALRSRLGRTPGAARGSGALEAGMTPVEGVPERATQRAPPTAARPGPGRDPAPRLQQGLNAAPPVPSPAKAMSCAPGTVEAVVAPLPSEMANGDSEAHLRSDSDSDAGSGDFGYGGFDEDDDDGAICHTVAVVRTVHRLLASAMASRCRTWNLHDS